MYVFTFWLFPQIPQSMTAKIKPGLLQDYSWHVYG